MLTDQEVQLFEFRCPECYCPVLATVDQVGAPFTCPTCGSTDHLTPDATASRIAAAESSVASAAPSGTAQAATAAPAEVVEAQPVPVSEQRYQAELKKFMDRQGFTVSPVVRLFARLIDGVCMLVTMGFSFFLGLVLAAMVNGGQDELSPLATTVFIMTLAVPPLFLTLYQWSWTASDGKTIGKKLTGIRIARTDNKQPPGFWRGVAARTWANSLLGALIPFYSLVDVLFVFSSDGGRCLHDRIAGTIVLQGDAPALAPAEA